MSDVLLGAHLADGSLLVRVAVTTSLCEEARVRHGASPTATAALGRALTGALLLGATLKGRQSILLQWRGGGPLGAVVAEGRADLSVRGYVARPQEDVPSRGGKLDVGAGVGSDGNLVVVKDLGFGDPYRSSVRLQTGELGEDLAYYLLASEQIPSAVGLGVYLSPDRTVEVGGGFLVEALPSAEDEVLDRVQENVAALGSVTERLRAGEGAEGLTARLLAGLSYREHVLGMPRFHCTCGPERLDAALAALGTEGARRLFEERGEALVRCEFCATEWRKASPEGPWQDLTHRAPG